MSFKEYLLSESIAPIPVNFGTDKNFTNEKWINVSVNNDTLYYTITFIKDKYSEIYDRYYCIHIQTNGVISFTVADSFNIRLINDVDYILDNFSDNRHKTQRILNLFGKLVYIFLKGLEKIKVDKVYFSPANPSLGTAYESIVKNKFFTKRMNDLGYYLQDTSPFTFLRKEPNAS